jgi:hypothetical protein
MINEGILAGQRADSRKAPATVTAGRQSAAVVQMALSRFGPLRFTLQVFPLLPLPLSPVAVEPADDAEVVTMRFPPAPPEEAEGVVAFPGPRSQRPPDAAVCSSTNTCAISSDSHTRGTSSRRAGRT